MNTKTNKKILSTFNFDLSARLDAGFTLVELMVSLSLFIIVVVALVGSLYTVNDASRKVQAMRTVMDNINFAMETMDRNVRTSENISCGTLTDCPVDSGASHASISMNSTLGEHKYVKYTYIPKSGNVNGRIVKQTADLVLDPDTHQYKISGSLSKAVDITSPEINIEDFGFYVDGAKPGDGKQPSVIIKLERVATVVGRETIPFAIQTYLSQRTPETTP